MRESRAATLGELVSDLKHDLGKYVAWRSANYEDEVWEGPLGDELVEALQADVLRTLGGEAAWEIWARHTKAWSRPWSHAALDGVEAAVEALRSFADVIEAGRSASLAEARPAIRAAQQTIREGLRQAARDLRAR